MDEDIKLWKKPFRWRADFVSQKAGEPRLKLSLLGDLYDIKKTQWEQAKNGISGLTQFFVCVFADLLQNQLLHMLGD